MNTVKHYMRQFGKFLQHKAWLAVCFLILCACDVLDRNLTMLAIHSALAHLLFCQESTESQIAKIVEQIDWRRERRKNLTKNDLVDDDADRRNYQKAQAETK